MFDYYYRLFLDGQEAGARIVQADSLEQADAAVHTELNRLLLSSGSPFGEARATLVDQRYHATI